MDALLAHVLLVEPDFLVLQEMTAPMLAQLRHRLPDWKVCRKREVLEYYFNVTVMRLVRSLACYKPCFIKSTVISEARLKPGDWTATGRGPYGQPLLPR